MCGIAGIFNHLTSAPVASETVLRMTRLLAHRGPDGEGVYVDGAIGLGHRRLSIIDLSERGRNPMVTADGRYMIVYNGEVYNYVELRNELRAAGETFRTDTDTEVILALYARSGQKCLDRLNGMFAFAIWDTVERRLFLARDRVGIKPLYYVETPDGLAFASEAKSLFLCPGVACEPDVSAIPRYLTFGYSAGEQTLFKGVRKLPPGWAMTVDARGVQRRQFWDVTFQPAAGRSANATAAELRELLLDAVRIHMRSDVPVGVFLSGGLDSSATVALLAHQGLGRLKTFSVAYREGEPYDETRHARLVADRFETDHRELYVDPSEFGAFIPDYVWHMDEPVTEAAAISLYFVARLLREHVTVALSGEGADELFAGYRIYSYMAAIDRYRRLPYWTRRRLFEPVLNRVGSEKIRKYVRLSGKPLAERYLGVHLYEPMEDLYSRDLLELTKAAANPSPLAFLYDRMKNHDPLSQMLYVDFKAWLVDDLLVKADKMTMANSVELRVPFLDHRVVEYAATIPSSMKQRGATVKWILKRAMRGLVPAEIIAREKVGFPTPVAQMFRGRLSEYVHDVLLSARCLSRGYFDPTAVRALVDDHRTGRADVHEALWRLIVLEEWHRSFPDAVNASSGSRFETALGAAV